MISASLKLLLVLVPIYILITITLVFLGLSDSSNRAKLSLPNLQEPSNDYNEPINEDNSQLACYLDLVEGKTVCKVKCPIGSKTFSLPGMQDCRNWLSCDEISQLTNVRRLAESEVKNVQLADWQQWTVVYTTPRNLSSFDFVFNQTTRNVIGLAMDHSDKFTQLLGVCGYDTVVEYLPLGTLWNVEKILKSSNVLKSYNSPATRFRLCYSIAEAFQFLLHTIDGVKVMADIDYWRKAFSQFLITNDLRVVMNDVDMLLTNGSYFDCRVNHPYTDFVPPEVNCEFLRKYQSIEDLGDWLKVDLFAKPIIGNEPGEFMSQIFHQYDIWKIPDFCNFILGDLLDSNVRLKEDLDRIFIRCRNHRWFLRPDADEVVSELKLIADKFNFNLNAPTLI